MKRQAPDPLGYNPLKVMGIFRSELDRYYLYEKHVTVDPTNDELRWVWRQYEDYTDPVPLPRYVAEIPFNHVMPLSQVTVEHDYVAHVGHLNIGAWIDLAAIAAGR